MARWLVIYLFNYPTYICIVIVYLHLQMTQLDTIQLAPIEDIFKVDGGDGMTVSSPNHAASQAPLLRVRVELQDLVILIGAVKAT